MNIFSALFGIFRQRGLVTTLTEDRPLTGFLISATLVSILGGVLYGFAMGAGLGIDTALKDALKVGLIALLGMAFAIPIFWVAYRLLGREERFTKVAAVPLTFGATVAIILVITAPIVFLLSILAGFSPDAVYIHIVIVDLAALVGLYLAGVLIYHGFEDRKRLVIPNVIGFLMLGVIVVVLMSFLAPFLALRPTFSVGTDRLKDGLGIGVEEKVSQALAAATAADRVTYRFQTTNDNGDLERDYTVTRVGNDYLVDVHLHAVPGETFRDNRRIWLLDGEAFTDFDGGRIARTDPAALASFLEPALPPAPFTLSAAFSSASWRGYESSNRYDATGVTQSLEQAAAVLNPNTGRLSALTLGSAERGLHAETRVRDMEPALLDRAGLETLLNQAVVVGSVDRSDASMQDYVQEEAFFAVRYPRTWSVGSWSPSRLRVEFSRSCVNPAGCPELVVSVFDLEEGKGARQYADDLGRSLGLQPEYRDIRISTTTLRNESVGVVEYLFDRTVKGELQTTHHVEYIYVGQTSRYHLDFSDAQLEFETSRALFAEIAGMFTYLKSAP